MRSVLVLALVAAVLPARAIAEPADAKPWVTGVSDAEQAVALELYARGNVEFQYARFQQALELYKEAIKHWDHPAIRYNMAVCDNNLGRLLDAEADLERALRFGEEPLGHEIYVQGLNYRQNFNGRVGRIKVACREPDTRVSLDGNLLFVAPGEVEQVVLPGDHQIVASKPGFLTASEVLAVKPGTVSTHEVRLIPFKAATRMVRRWEWWKPWAVGAGGVGTIAIGGVAYLLASNRFTQYDSGITARCPHGCDGATLSTFSDLTAAKDRGDIEYVVAVSLLAVGGAAVVAGLAGIIVNQPHSMAAQITPTPGGGAALSVRATF